MARRWLRASKLRTPSQLVRPSLSKRDQGYLSGSLLISQCSGTRAPGLGDRRHIMEEGVVDMAASVGAVLDDIDEAHVPHEVLRQVRVARVHGLGEGLVD